MKKKIFWGILIVLLIAPILFLLMLKSIEVTDSYYEKYEDVASIPNIFEAGWVPNWLPTTAVNIQETHDISTNEAWLIFKYSPGDNFLSSCTPMDEKDVALPPVRQVDQFPEYVLEAINKIQAESFAYYLCDQTRNQYLAIDSKNSTAYVWMTF